jgi:hypothetical protein
MNKIAKHNVESPLLKKANIKESDVVRLWDNLILVKNFLYSKSFLANYLGCTCILYKRWDE